MINISGHTATKHNNEGKRFIILQVPQSTNEAYVNKSKHFRVTLDFGNGQSESFEITLKDFGGKIYCPEDMKVLCIVEECTDEEVMYFLSKMYNKHVELEEDIQPSDWANIALYDRLGFSKGEYKHVVLELI